MSCSPSDKKKDDNNPRSCIGEPDVTVVVGGTVFREHSKHLCCWSGYFEAAFRSGMKESANHHFEFPDRDPDEWEWIMSLLVPFATARITLGKLDTALSWFDFLCISRGMEECDNVLYKAVLHLELSTAHGFSRMLEYLSTGLQYNLPQSKTQYFQLVRAVFNRAPRYLTKEHLDTLALLILSHGEDCRKELWSLLEKFLPAPITDSTQQDCLLHTGALQSLVLSEIQQKETAQELAEKKLQVETLEHQMDTLEQQHQTTASQLQSTQRKLTRKNNQWRRMVSTLDSTASNRAVSQLKRHLKSDSICGHALPLRWSSRKEAAVAEIGNNEDDACQSVWNARASKKRKAKKRLRRLLHDEDEDGDLSLLFGMSSSESEG